MPVLRLYIDMPLSEGGEIHLPDDQCHYVRNVMRAKAGDVMRLFNGRDGDWFARIDTLSKKEVSLRVEKQQSAFRASPDIWLVFCPIKAKSEWVVEKATEMGVSRIVPVRSARTIISRINEERYTATAREAAEQCERHDIPEISPMASLQQLLDSWPAERILLHADEQGGGADLNTVLKDLSNAQSKYAVLIGPEGGFTPEERNDLERPVYTRAFSMGPRILRADTAAVAALSNIMAQAGDWYHRPRFIEG